VLYLFVDAPGNENLSGLGNTFKPRSNVDPITINVVRFDNNVAKVHANPVFYPGILRQRCIATHQILLNHDAAANCFNRTIENRYKAVTGRFDQLAIMLANGRLYQFALDPLDTIMRAFFVEFH